MALNVKKKIWLGTSFLFVLLLLTGGVSIYYTASLKSEAKNVLKANYESLSYCHTMQEQLNNYKKDYNTSLLHFETALQKQENNITETGEQQATVTLRKYFNQFKNSDTSEQNLKLILGQLQQLLNINMQAIQKKNIAAQKSADDALTIIIALGSFVFLITFTFIINFPSIVTKPIIELTDAIKISL